MAWSWRGLNDATQFAEVLHLTHLTHITHITHLTHLTHLKHLTHLAHLAHLAQLRLVTTSDRQGAICADKLLRQDTS